MVHGSCFVCFVALNLHKNIIYIFNYYPVCCNYNNNNSNNNLIIN